MPNQNYIILFVLTLTVFNHNIFSDAKLLINKFENCDQNNNYKSKINVRITTVDNAQYGDGTFIFSAPIDNHIKANISVETLIGDKYLYLLSFTEKKGCDAINKYLGEFWYDMERHAQIIPGLCPISAGRYHLHNYPLKFDKAPTAKNFPFGNFRFIVMVYDRKNDIFSCILCELENRV